MTQLLQTAATGTVLILTTALLRRALKKRLPPEVWLVLWAVCLFRLLTPIVPESPLSLYALPRQLCPESPPIQTATLPVQPDWSAPLGEMFGPPPPMSSASAMPPASPIWNWDAVLMAVWLLGSAVTALRLTLSWRRTHRAVYSVPLLPPSDPRYAALPPGVRLREGPVEGAPLTFGAVRPTVVLPPGLSGAALACVLAHEGVHARRRDNLWHYAVALVRVVFWWDPAVWLMAKLLRRDIELSCDRAALRRLGLDRRREYAMTILDLSIQGEDVPFSRAFGQKQAEERIIAIMKYKKVTVLALVLSILLVCGVTVAFATNPIAEDSPAQAEHGPTENIHSELIVPTQEEVRRNGYPINENGETYGPDVPDDDWDEIPDLQLTEDEKSGLIGYLRRSEYPMNPGVHNPDEAMAYMDHQADWENHTERDHYQIMYLQDGVTVIGRFRIGGECPCGL